MDKTWDAPSELVYKVTLAIHHSSLTYNSQNFKTSVSCLLALEDAQVLGEVQEMGKMEQVWPWGLVSRAWLPEPSCLGRAVTCSGEELLDHVDVPFRHRCVIADSLSSMKRFKNIDVNDVYCLPVFHITVWLLFCFLKLVQEIVIN